MNSWVLTRQRLFSLSNEFLQLMKWPRDLKWMSWGYKLLQANELVITPLASLMGCTKYIWCATTLYIGHIWCLPDGWFFKKTSHYCTGIWCSNQTHLGTTTLEVHSCGPLWVSCLVPFPVSRRMSDDYLAFQAQFTTSLSILPGAISGSTLDTIRLGN